MTENTNMLVFYEVIENDEPKLKYYSTHSTTAPFSVRVPGKPGVGGIFWAFPDIGGKNPNTIAFWSFQGAPTASSSVNANIASIAAIETTYDEVFDWLPEEEPES